MTWEGMGLRFKSQTDADLETPSAPDDLLPPTDLNLIDQRLAMSSGLSSAAGANSEAHPAPRRSVLNNPRTQVTGVFVIQDQRSLASPDILHTF